MDYLYYFSKKKMNYTCIMIERFYRAREISLQGTLADHTNATNLMQMSPIDLDRRIVYGPI